MLEQWIAEGAIWPGQMQERIEEKIEHWSFNSVKKQNVPNAIMMQFGKQTLWTHFLTPHGIF